MLSTNTKFSTMFQQILSEYLPSHKSKYRQTSSAMLFWQILSISWLSVRSNIFLVCILHYRGQMLESLQICLKFHLSNSSAKYLESRNRALQGRSLPNICYFCCFLWQMHLPPSPTPPSCSTAISEVLVPIPWF